LPGPKGKRFDYLTVDPDDHLVIVAHMHGNQTYFVDTQTNQVAATITDTPGVEGVEYVPDGKKVYTSNSGDNTIGVIDIAKRKVIKKLKTEAKPDGSTYAALFHKLYVSDERGKAEAVVDVRTDTIVRTLHFDSETGMPQYDPVAKLVYINLQDIDRLAAIDPQDDRVVAQYPVAGCRGNHGMALATQQRRAFLVCEENNLLAVFDLEKHAVIQTLPLPGGGDVVKADAGRGRVLVACYSGEIAVFQAESSGQYKKIADASVEKRVHSLAVDPDTVYLYVPEEQEQGAPSSRLIVYSLSGEVR
jgi:YVTN family beta-propeller protein